MIKQDKVNISLEDRDLIVLLDQLDNSFLADEELLEQKQEQLSLTESDGDTELVTYIQGEIERTKDRMNENRRVLTMITRSMENDRRFCVIRWAEEDIVVVLEECGVEPTRENIEIVKSQSGILQDRGVFGGLETLREIVNEEICLKTYQDHKGVV
ncbi:hypothetical protein [Thermoactinomyces sp. DSM 45892]|uniref:hypothetical protein n=1 Tax=Thermoactinomyces sp. DSM 45892 TaxID=1882753 RepID=UPI00089A76EC|nr:hypothetical protein [Thermoactinomyces sp. DSM 45892]SDY88879.1 hypothetical protein SAMN05444416_109179 [Thermoactinomyces sp. DSM 45892]